MSWFRILLLSVVFTAAAKAESIRVGAAISLKDAITEIARKFETVTGDHVDFVFGASGQIMAQIKSGADADLFISAGIKQVSELEKDKLADKVSERAVVENRLVLIVPADAKNPPAGFAGLTDASVTKVAAGEPKTVPAGTYAKQVFDAMKLSDALAGKLVYGTNVRQVLAYVERGEVSAGVVYATDAKEAGDKVKVVATAAPDTHEPIVYPGVIVSSSKKHDAAEKFLAYLGEPDAKAVFKKYGFTLPHKE